jgi:hypothetical protein
MRSVCILFVFFAAGLGACLPVCQTKTTRCNGSRVEICDSNGRWQQVMDCSKVVGPKGSTWSCCPASEGDAGVIHTCLPDDGRDGGVR